MLHMSNNGFKVHSKLNLLLKKSVYDVKMYYSRTINFYYSELIFKILSVEVVHLVLVFKKHDTLEG